MMIPIVELRGTEVVPVDHSAANLADAAQNEPENGVYLVARTYHHGNELLLDEHFDRIERSARLVGGNVVVPREQICGILADLIEKNAFEDGRFRVTAVLDDPVWYRISVEKAREVPASVLTTGVHCELWEGSARANAEVKSTAWIHQRGSAGADVYERLLVDKDDRILEGASSNAYFVVDGVLRTAGERVLAGIARRIVLDVAPAIIRVQTDAIKLSSLRNTTEAFLSSATRGVVPIRSIGEYSFGTPGAISRAIHSAYKRRVLELLRPLRR